MHCPTILPVEEKVPGGHGVHFCCMFKTGLKTTGLETTVLETTGDNNVPGGHPLEQPPFAVADHPAMHFPAEFRVESLKMHSWLTCP